MTFLEVVFYVFAAVLIASSLLVVTVRYPVRAALFLWYRIISVTGATEEVLGDFGIGQDVAGIAGVDYLATRHDVTAV